MDANKKTLDALLALLALAKSSTVAKADGLSIKPLLNTRITTTSL